MIIMVSGVDTRALTKHIRESGTMPGKVSIRLDLFIL